MYTFKATIYSIFLAGVSAEVIYDYVIVGAGTSGLVVANRLSEDPRVSVAIIEPGGDTRDNPNVTTIDTFGVFLRNAGTELDWAYMSVPQAGAGDRPLGYMAGKAIGGTSTINGMTYLRGDAAEIDAWEELGSDGWSWESLFPYYKTYEHFDKPTKAQAEAGASYHPEYHGENGPMQVSYPYSLANGSLHQIMQDTWENISVPTNKDPNSGEIRGFGVWPQTIHREQNIRWDSARAFYWPVERRRNLKLLKGAATKLNWRKGSGKDAVADGVEYVRENGKKAVVRAKKEVILSAGALTSPLILEASGIGNSQLLKSLGIKQVINLPGVGENLQDQPNASLQYETTENITGMVPYAAFVTAQDLFGDDLASVASDTKLKIPAWAKLISAASNQSKVSVNTRAIAKVLSVQHDHIFNKNVTLGEIITTASGNMGISPHWNLLPFSRGSVHLGSDKNVNKPIIDPRFFLVDFDLTAQIKIGRLARKSWTTSPAKELVVSQAAPNTTVLPEDASDQQWEEYTRNAFGPNSHPLGTAAMMARELGGVVDSNLQVYGTRNVRVVDASVIPIQISGHLTATLYALAEKAADAIKKPAGKCK